MEVREETKQQIYDMPIIQNNIAFSTFEIEQVADATLLWLGSDDDPAYNWPLDISSLSEEERKVVEKLEKMVEQQRAEFADETH